MSRAIKKRNKKASREGGFFVLRESPGVTSSRLRDAVTLLPYLYYSIDFQKMLLLFLPPVPPQFLRKEGFSCVITERPSRYYKLRLQASWQITSFTG